MTYVFALISGLFFHVVGEGVVNLSKKAENFTDKENYIDFRLRLLGEPGKNDDHLHIVTSMSCTSSTIVLPSILL